MDGIKYIHLDEVDSTNRFLHDYKGDEGTLLTVAVAEKQTAGRGSGSNTWESEPGKNLTFSMMFRSFNLPAARQFGIIEAGALSVIQGLLNFDYQPNYLADDFKIKWPNDVYWQDRKIAGILSECEVSGGVIKRGIVGIGINIGQTEFGADVPNAVSLCQIPRRPVSEYSLEKDKQDVLKGTVEGFVAYLHAVKSGFTRHYHLEYLENLYRKDGIYVFEDKDGRFRAKILSVEHDGHLVLQRVDGTVSKYAFKEVQYILD